MDTYKSELFNGEILTSSKASNGPVDTHETVFHKSTKQMNWVLASYRVLRYEYSNSKQRGCPLNKSCISYPKSR